MSSERRLDRQARAVLQVAVATLFAAALAAGDMRVSGMAPGETVVTLLRTPAGGIQPMAEVDEAGTIHLIYFSGNASSGDAFYVTKRAVASAFSQPIRVNSQPGSVIATGTVRGAHMTRGRNGLVHVAWMGSAEAKPRGPGNASPMLYARSGASGKSFEEQRNVVQHAFGLDGGATVAADSQGTVYVLWHAGAGHLEERRRVWLATSTDDGAAFAREVAVTEPSAGVCACCGMTAIVDRRGTLRTLYRAFSPPDHRDMYLLTSRRSGSQFDRRLLQRWQIAACPLSTASAMTAGDEAVIAWETNGQVAWALVDQVTSIVSSPTSPPGAASTRKHPAVALSNGEVLLAWTEGMAWGVGGTLHWQGFDRQGKPTQVSGRAPGVPVWSRPAVVAHRQGGGGFTIIY